ncbi:hypothetical protein F6455_06475 [Proteobacteria bacterium 005FR1]|nr:hypothetical protein [Proteobacteria bacterium 005FR1]
MLRLCILLLAMPLVLVGCSGLPEQRGAGEAPEMAVEEAVTPDVQPEQAPLATKHTVEDDVRQLLKDAESALAEDRLTTPEHDNAFDRYQAVLLLRPDNEQAKTGLQLIFTRYMSLARSALARSRPGTARALVERARLVDRDNPLLAELTAEISSAQQQLAQTVGSDKSKEILLDVENLERRDEKVVEKLQSLANQIKESEETLLIVARSDAEGRWIYQRMSEGVPDYRLRGDIRLGREPKILLLPPLE